MGRCTPIPDLASFGRQFTFWGKPLVHYVKFLAIVSLINMWNLKAWWKVKRGSGLTIVTVPILLQPDIMGSTIIKFYYVHFGSIPSSALGLGISLIASSIIPQNWEKILYSTKAHRCCMSWTVMMKSRCSAKAWAASKRKRRNNFAILNISLINMSKMMWVEIMIIVFERNRKKYWRNYCGSWQKGKAWFVLKSRILRKWRSKSILLMLSPGLFCLLVLFQWLFKFFLKTMFNIQVRFLEHQMPSRLYLAQI